MTGRISEVSNTSTLRRLSRRLRTIIVAESPSRFGCRISPAAAESRLRSVTAMSDMCWLLLCGGGAGRRRDMAGQGEEDVVERRLVHDERGHGGTIGIDLVEHAADVRCAPVGADTNGQLHPIDGDDPVA